LASAKRANSPRGYFFTTRDDGVPAFTRDGIDNLREIIADQRAAEKGHAS
jgi:hypothetical protein